MSNHIFITGATGNIGTQIIKSFQKNHISFTAGVMKVPENDLDYAFKVMNYADPISMERAFAGTHTLFLLFPIVDSILDFAKNAIAVAKKVGVHHIVRSSAIQADPMSPYKLLAVHGKIDEMLKESGIQYTITQPSSFMQNFVNFIGYSIKSGTVYASTGNGKSGWIDVRDIASANAKILRYPSEHQNATYELTGDQAFTLADGLQQISASINKPIELVQIPQDTVNAKMREYGMSDQVIEMIASMEVATKEGILEKVTPDLNNLIDRAPINFQRYIEDHKTYW